MADGPTLASGKLRYLQIPATDTPDPQISMSRCSAGESGGGEIVQPVGADAPEVTARFRDPAGNVLGLYQAPSLRAVG